MAAASKPMSFLPEIKAFAEEHKNDPYADLMTAPAKAGWDVHTQETEAVGQNDGTTLVRFAVSIGRDGKYEAYDTLTVKTGVGPGPVSIAARLLLEQELIWMFFRRLPDPVRAPEQTVEVKAGETDDIVLPGETPLEPEQEYVPESAPIDRRAKILPDLVDHLEPDGVPVFRDLDDLPEHFTDAEIIARVLEDVDKAAVRFTSNEQLLALFAKNAAAIGPGDSFLVELGTPADRTALKAILDRHQARIEAAAAPAREVRIPGGKGSAEAAERAPRRRRAA